MWLSSVPVAIVALGAMPAIGMGRKALLLVVGAVLANNLSIPYGDC